MAVEVGELIARMKMDTSGMQAGVDSLAQVTKDITKQFDGMRQELADIGPDVEKSASTAGSALSGVSTKAILATQAAGVALAGIGANAARMAVNFESSFADVKKTVNATEAEFKAMSGELRALAEEVPSTTTELNKIAAIGGQLGIAKESITDFTKTIAMVATSTNLTADAASTGFARIGNIMGVSAKEFSNLGSAVVDLGNKGNSTEAEIVAMAQRLAGAGKTVGMTTADVLGISTGLADVGIKAEMGGTAMSKVMMRMAGDVATGGGHLSKFAEVAGVSAEEFSDKFKTDAAGAIADFIAGLGKIQTEGGDLFGTLDDLGMKGALLRETLLRTASAGEGVAKSLDLSRTAWTQNTALSTEAGKRYETVASQLEIFRNKLSNTQITFGEAFLPMMVKAIEAADPFVKLLASMAQGFAGLHPTVQMMVVGLVALAGSLGPVLIATASLVRAFMTVKPLLMLVGGALATPAALFLGLAAAVVIAYQNMEAIGQAVSHVSEWFNELVGKSVQSVIDGFKHMGRTVIQFILDMKDTVVRLTREMVSAIGDAVGARLTAMLDRVKAPIEATKQLFKGLYDAVVGRSYIPDMVSEIGDHMRNLDIAMTAPARTAVVNTGNTIKSGTTTWQNSINQFVSSANQAWGSISQTMGTNLAKMTDEEVQWGEVTKQIGLQVLSTAITTAIGVATQWAIAGAAQVATQITTDTARVTSATTADAIILASATTSAAGSTSIWGGASDMITGFFGNVAGGFSQIAASLVEGVIAIGGFIMQVLGAIGTALSATVFGIPFAGAIFAGIALIAAALALSGNLPFLAEGGIVNGPTLAMIGERGPEAVVPLDKADGFSGGRGSQTLIVMLDGKMIGRTVIDSLADQVYVRTKLR